MRDDNAALDDIMKIARAILEDSKPRPSEDTNQLPKLNLPTNHTSLSQVNYSEKPKNNLKHRTNYGNTNKIKVLALSVSISLCIWLISFYSVYLPISGWITPTVPYTINVQVLQVFLISAVLAAGTSLILGIIFLRKKKSFKLS